MDVVKLGPGEHAPKDADCIRVEAASDGRFRLIASVLQDCGDVDEVESVAMIRGEPYPTYADAEAAGLAWAADHGVSRLYVETMERD